MLAGLAEAREEFRRDVAAGLARRPYRIHPKHFYDERGSTLFEEITRQPEYYLTRVETSILERSLPAMDALVDGDVTVVELGSGSSAKTRILIEGFLESQERLRYVPIDISATVLHRTAKRLDAAYPGLTVTPIASEYGPGLSAANRLLRTTDRGGRMLVLFLGSSLGNMEPDEAAGFLGGLAARLSGGDRLLVGFDLVKDEKILNAAYNDEAGVTARFNLNLLARINRELGGRLDLARFSHLAFYHDDEERIEMHLVSEDRQEVRIEAAGLDVPFERGERIHTENSYKYRKTGIEELASRCDLRVVELFTDENDWFALALFSPA